jgi:hypothetical protein
VSSKLFASAHHNYMDATLTGCMPTCSPMHSRMLAYTRNTLAVNSNAVFKTRSCMCEAWSSVCCLVYRRLQTMHHACSIVQADQGRRRIQKQRESDRRKRVCE